MIRGIKYSNKKSANGSSWQDYSIGQVNRIAGCNSAVLNSGDFLYVIFEDLNNRKKIGVAGRVISRIPAASVPPGWPISWKKNYKTDGIGDGNKVIFATDFILRLNNILVAKGLSPVKDIDILGRQNPPKIDETSQQGQAVLEVLKTLI